MFVPSLHLADAENPVPVAIACSAVLSPELLPEVPQRPKGARSLQRTRFGPRSIRHSCSLPTR